MGCPFHPSATFEERQFPRGRPRGRAFAWQTAWHLSGIDFRDTGRYRRKAPSIPQTSRNPWPV